MPTQANPRERGFGQMNEAINIATANGDMLTVKPGEKIALKWQSSDDVDTYIWHDDLVEFLAASR
jgi:hypothetical protein